MLALVLIAIISNGYIIISGCPNYFYKLHRYDGQLLYIKATFLGILSTSISLVLDSFVEIVDYTCKFFPQTNWIILSETETSTKYFIFLLFSFLLSILYCIFVRLILFFRAWWHFHDTDRQSRPSYNEIARILLIGTVLKDSPLDKLFYRSYIQNIFLLITMSDRKVYVGRVISLGEPTEKQGPDQEISIVPVFSGYRDKDTLSVHLNNDYSTGEDSKDFQLILKQENIVSACEFIKSLYIKNATTSPSGHHREHFNPE